MALNAPVLNLVFSVNSVFGDLPRMISVDASDETLVRAIYGSPGSVLSDSTSLFELKATITWKSRCSVPKANRTNMSIGCIVMIVGCFDLANRARAYFLSASQIGLMFV